MAASEALRVPGLKRVDKLTDDLDVVGPDALLGEPLPGKFGPFEIVRLLPRHDRPFPSSMATTQRKDGDGATRIADLTTVEIELYLSLSFGRPRRATSR